MKKIKPLLPFLSSVLILAAELILPDSTLQPSAAKPYFTYFCILACAVCLICFIAALFIKPFYEKLSYKGCFAGGALLFLGVINLLTAKFAVLPPVYFPSPDRIIGAAAKDALLLAKCVGYSAKLLLVGVFWGAAVGITTGLFIGFNKHAEYWISPIVRVLGPIPSTAWIPLVLISFPTTLSASRFLIALAVWFPTTVMTSSGVSNINNAFFEVSDTLGAGYFYKIFKVGVPAAMPHIFLGLFNGICSSFITLMTAEMMGAKYGIGWYVNWQKEMMSYANVYAGLIIIAVVFSFLVAVTFRIRDKILVWQKGVIKW